VVESFENGSTNISNERCLGAPRTLAIDDIIMKLEAVTSEQTHYNCTD
jgi:hypothetical protein